MPETENPTAITFNSPRAALDQVLKLIARGATETATHVALGLTKRSPGYAPFWDALARAGLHQAPELADSAARRALVLRPATKYSLETLHDLERKNGTWAQLRRLKQIVLSDPDTAAAWVQLTQVLRGMAFEPPFSRLERRAALLAPGSSEAWTVAGNWFLASGDRRAAIRAFHRLAVSSRTPAQGLYQISVADPAALPSVLVDMAEARLEAGVDDDQETELLGFALFAHRDRRDEKEKAFGYLTVANAARRRRVQPEMSVNRTVLERVLQAPAPRTRRARENGGAYGPAFIIGLPGSGTTLLESMLSMHQDVVSAGELNLIHKIALTLPDYPTGYTDLGDRRLDTLAQQYQRGMAAIAPGEVRFKIDKMPTNFIHVGLIDSMFPAAPILQMVRDPMAVGWSLFRRRFDSGQTYSSNLENIAEFIALHQRYTAHWKKVLPGRILQVQYEDLVDAPERTLRWILEHMKLPWSPTCLEFARSGRRVTTASAVSVRSDINQARNEDWRRYAPQLEPLKQALARNGIVTG